MFDEGQFYNLFRLMSEKESAIVLDELTQSYKAKARTVPLINQAS